MPVVVSRTGFCTKYNRTTDVDVRKPTTNKALTRPVPLNQNFISPSLPSVLAILYWILRTFKTGGLDTKPFYRTAQIRNHYFGSAVHLKRYAVRTYTALLAAGKTGRSLHSQI